MHNKLSFLNSFCVSLFIGKVGHLGTLGAVAWPLVFLPLVLDLLLDFLLKLGYVDRAIGRLNLFVKTRALIRIAKKIKDDDHG